MPWFLGNSHFFLRPPFVWLPFIFIWSLIWKGVALWESARRGEKGWFIAFLLIHTLGILEILYLVFVAKTLFQTEPADTGKESFREVTKRLTGRRRTKTSKKKKRS